MNFANRLRVILLGLGVVSAAMAADFTGRVYSTLQDGRTTTELVYALSGDHMRIDMPDGKAGFKGAAILDLSAQQMTVVMAEQKMAMVMPMQKAMDQALAEANKADGTWEKTTEHRDILGYDCTKYVGTNQDGRFEIWATQELGRFVGPGALNPMQRKQAKGWEQLLAGKDFFPMKVTGFDQKGKETFSLETTKVDRTPLPDSLFTVPEGYQIMDMSGMMGAMGGAGGLNPFGK